MSLAVTYDLPTFARQQPQQRQRTVITSKARAAAIVERVAEKHRLKVAVMLCAKWDRFAVLARAEAAHALKHELGWSIRMIGGYLGYSHTRARKLLAFHEKWVRRAPVIVPTPDPDGRIRELEAEIARLAGTYLCEQMAKKFDLRMRCAIVLSIMSEAYPRYVRGPAILELYNEACEVLGYGQAQDGATHNLIAKNIGDLDKQLREVGFDGKGVMEVGDLPSSRRLTDEAAQWLYEQIGAPKLSQIELHRERCEAQTGVSAIRVMGM